MLKNFTHALGIPSVTCARSFSATMLPHVKNGWTTQNFWNTPLYLESFSEFFWFLTRNPRHVHHIHFGFTSLHDSQVILIFNSFLNLQEENSKFKITFVVSFSKIYKKIENLERKFDYFLMGKKPDVYYPHVTSWFVSV